jgi:parvulin-like peptidyl-prolyl isomerase
MVEGVTRRRGAARGAFGVVAVALLLVACGHGAPPAAAKVGSQSIPRSDLVAEVGAIEQASAEGAPATAGARSDHDALVARVLTRRLESEVVRAEVRKRQLTIDKAALDAAGADAQAVTERDEPGTWARLPAWYQKELAARAADVVALQVALSGTPITEAALRSAYEQGIATEFTVNCVRQVLVATEADAQQVESRLAAGEDFATVAGQASTDTGTAAKGGDLGCTTAAQAGYDPAVQRAIDTQAVGVPGGPVAAPGGWDVLEVMSRQVRSFDDAREAVRLMLLSASASRVRDLVAVRLRTIPVWVDAQFGTFDPAAPILTVRPPHADAAPRTEIPGLNPVAPPGGNSGNQQPEPFD